LVVDAPVVAPLEPVVPTPVVELAAPWVVELPAVLVDVAPAGEPLEVCVPALVAPPVLPVLEGVAASSLHPRVSEMANVRTDICLNILSFRR
jgi:hypothetical protein